MMYRSIKTSTNVQQSGKLDDELWQLRHGKHVHEKVLFLLFFVFFVIICVAALILFCFFRFRNKTFDSFVFSLFLKCSLSLSLSLPSDGLSGNKDEWFV